VLSPADQAATAEAAQAAERAAVEIRHPSTMAELTAVAELFVDVWGTDPADPPIGPELLRALAHIDGYVAAAYRGERVVGAGVGFHGRPDAFMLHSHIVGVDARVQARNIGYAVKLDQRAWALKRGIRHVTWTFDPLVARNAYFNLGKLGARAGAYLPDFYGEMRDGINAGQGSDRLLVEWDVTAALRATPGAAYAVPAAAEVTLDQGESGAPVRRPGRGPLLACRVPDDIVGLRGRDPDLARSWRHALRETLGHAMAEDYEVTAVTRTGWYVLEKRSGG
jgi:predicted GNAT superfamily acetyltransferase